MNKYNLHLAGGALLATTALVSGSVAVQAQATIKAVAAATALPAAFTAAPLASTVLTATGSAITVGPQSLLVDSTANIFEKTVVVLNVSGAEFDTAVAPSDVSIFQQSASGTLIAPTGAANATVTVFSDRIRITDVTRLTWSAITVSGYQFRNAQALATAGNSISISGTISNSAETATLESIASKAVVTSRVPGAAEVTAGSTITVSNTANPQFSKVNQAAGGVTNNAANANSAILARVALSFTASVASTNLTTSITAANSISTVEIKLTHNVLTDPALVSVTLDSTAGGASVATRTPGQFVSGTVTFSPTVAQATNTGGIFVVANFNGSTAIQNWAAGTVATTQTAAAPTLVAMAAGSGTATALNRGGLNTQVNFFQPSVNTFLSFLRVTNTGSTAGAVTLTIRNSATGAALGTYTSPAVSSGGTIQISAATLESQAVPAITPTAGVPYDITVSGPITGYVQHIGFKADTGVVTDLSAFRSGGAVTP